MWLALEHLELETHRGDRLDVGKAELACEIALLTLKLYEEEEDPWNCN